MNNPRCGGCGFINLHRASSCRRCGANLPALAASSPSGAPRAEERAQARTPAWAYVFIAACVLIPVVSLGGAIPGGIAGGGAMTCRQIAKLPDLPAAARVLLCLGTTALCWVLFIILALWLTGA